MIDLPPIIERIKALLDEDTEASVTYAALEARLALEKVCYDRLRQRHDYISHDQLRRWQPGAVINILIKEVDQHLGETMILSIGKSPADAGIKPEDDEYVEIGTEVGFDPKRIAKMWQALANLALHVRLPEHKGDHIPTYGDKARIGGKVAEVRAELERLAKGTMIFSGLGAEVSFNCGACGEKNKRRAGLLREGQSVFCINPECKASWTARKENGEFVFQGETADFTCQGCGETIVLAKRFLLDLRYDHRAAFVCRVCDQKNYAEWRLTQVAPASEAGAVVKALRKKG